ncbi:YgjV family protein [Teredinibacter haidensis]|uniref:YgjV family protein n=1 Tax=Teredinibacter haidensis TaxID=2731755 RepID=UPI001FE77B7C|nr:YgjV family protein [Teredinibacter haidensis]
MFAQALGFVSFALGIMCFYQKDDKRLKMVMVIMSLNNIIHFGLLGAPTASFGAALSMIRAWISLYTSSRWIALVFIVITLVLGLFLSESIGDMFPIIGTCIGTYALFCLKGIKMRIAFLCGALCWLANNILVGSIGGTLLELTLLAVNLNTIRRLWFGRKLESSVAN